jgi:hypothetical protein
LIYDQKPADLVSLDEATNSLVVVGLDGRAYRSRSGRALCLRMPGLPDGRVMAPWKAFIGVVEGRVKTAMVSIVEQGIPAEQIIDLLRMTGSMEGCP